ncbi:MAG TPA: hypothetical protein VL981_07260 [Candidatus Methylacidiphilales bacterium]|nr:hypothetical protein [Candidatus Methylacidiphilales bacterium]
MTGTEIFKHTAAYERDSRRIRLHAPEWKLLLAFDGQRTLAEVALSAEVSFAEAFSLTEKFLGQGWIAEQPITLEQYLKRTGAADLASIGAAVPPAVVLHAPKNAAALEAPQAAPAPSPRGPMRLSAVVDFIVSQADNALLGRLSAYRVFLRVPHELLQAEEIVSVNLVNDSSLIRTEALQKAIAEAVQEIVKRPLPDSVYAGA